AVADQRRGRAREAAEADEAEVAAEGEIVPVDEQTGLPLLARVVVPVDVRVIVAEAESEDRAVVPLVGKAVVVEAPPERGGAEEAEQVVTVGGRVVLLAEVQAWTHATAEGALGVIRVDRDVLGVVAALARDEETGEPELGRAHVDLGAVEDELVARPVVRR